MTLPLKTRLIRGAAAFVVPAAISLFLGLYLLPNGGMDFPTAMPIAVAGGAIGMAIYYLTLKRPSTWFWAGQGGFAVVAALACWILAKTFALSPEQRVTCPVCGYATLKEAGSICGVCGIAINDKTLEKSGLASPEELIKEEQTVFFAPRQAGAPVDFNSGAPQGSTYRKDSTWKPSVTAQEVMEALRLADSLKALTP